MSDPHLDPETLELLAAGRQDPFLRRACRHLARACPACRPALEAAGFPPPQELSGDSPCFGAKDLPDIFTWQPEPTLPRLFTHLAQVCPGCARELGFLPAAVAAGVLPADLVVTELEVGLAQARLMGSAADKLLAAGPAAGGEELFGIGPVAAWGLAEALCEASRRAASEAPEAALPFADRAVAAARRAALPCLPRECSQELLMLALAHRGNALRVVEELRCAAQAFREARELWQAADGRQHFVDFRARALSLEASLSLDRRRLEDALEDLAEAEDLARGWAAAPPAFHATLQLKRSQVYCEQGDLAGAVASCRRVAETVAREETPRLWLIARHNELDYLTKMGEYWAASTLLPEVLKILEKVGTPVDHLRGQWISARIQAGIGHPFQAERLLEDVQAGFLSLGEAYSAAVVSLELATVYFQQGKLRRVQELALAILPIFRALDIPREALATLAVFRQAATVGI